MHCVRTWKYTAYGSVVVNVTGEKAATNLVCNKGRTYINGYRLVYNTRLQFFVGVGSVNDIYIFFRKGTTMPRERYIKFKVTM